MFTCKDCVHYEACKDMYDLLTSLEDIDMLDNKYAEQGCLLFKNKADFVEVRHGYWIDDSIPMHTSSYFKCSVCEGHDDQEYDYCHHCGAKMDGKEGADNDKR